MQSNDSSNTKTVFITIKDGEEPTIKEIDYQKERVSEKTKHALAMLSEIRQKVSHQPWDFNNDKMSKFELSYEKALEILKYWHDVPYAYKLEYWESWQLNCIAYLIDDDHKSVTGIKSNIPITDVSGYSFKFLSLVPREQVSEDKEDQVATFVAWATSKAINADWTQLDSRDFASMLNKFTDLDTDSKIGDRIKIIDDFILKKSQTAQEIQSKLNAGDSSSLNISDYRHLFTYIGYSDFLKNTNDKGLSNIANKMDLFRNGTLEEIKSVFGSYIEGRNLGLLQQEWKQIKGETDSNQLKSAQRIIQLISSKVHDLGDIAARWSFGHEQTVFALNDMLLEAITFEHSFKEGLRYYERETKEHKFRKEMNDQFLSYISKYKGWYNENKKQIQDLGPHNCYTNILGFFEGVDREVSGYIPSKVEEMKTAPPQTDSVAAPKGKREVGTATKYRDLTLFYCQKASSGISRIKALNQTLKHFDISKKTLDRAIKENRHLLDTYKVTY